MCDVNNVFAADILYHDYCCKAYFNKYQAKIAEIMGNLEMEDSVAAKDDTFKARFLALNLDFSKSAHSLTSIRDSLNEGSADIVSNRSVKQLIIELYGDAVCFTYPSSKRKSQMVSWLQTFISWCITTSMDSVSWLCFCIFSAQLHTWGSWWQDDVPCAGHLKLPVRTYIHDTVIRWYRCLCVPTVPLYSDLERPWSPRALANSQFRNEKSDLTTPQHLQCIEKWLDQVSSSSSCTDMGVIPPAR